MSLLLSPGILSQSVGDKNQFYEDFSTTTIGEIPAGAELKRDAASGDYAVRDLDSQNALQFSPVSAGTGPRGLAYDILCGGSCEIAAVARDVEFNPALPCRLLLFGSDSPDNEYGLIFVGAGSNNFRLYSRVDGTFTELGKVSVASDRSTYYNILLAVTPGSPNVIDGYFWEISAEKPATPTITRTDSGLSLVSGWAGHVGFSESADVRFRAVAIGINGSPAPTGPV